MVLVSCVPEKKRVILLSTEIDGNATAGSEQNYKPVAVLIATE
jgi:hypothetical protein